ncbi:MAG: TPM domain-containing protein [Lentisphaerota bacterium]
MACVLALACMKAGAMPAVPPLSGRVVDRAGMLPGDDAVRVERAILDLEQATGGQMAVLTLPTLDGDSLERFSVQVAETWKIGNKGRDDGAILLLVRDSHEMRLEIGRGWEGPVNDARAGDIIRGMTPYFRAGRFGDGTVFAVQRVHAFVTGKTPTGMPEPPPENDDYIHIGSLRIHVFWLFVACCLLVFLIGTWSNRRRGNTYRSRGSSGSSWGGGGGGGGFSGGGGGFSGGGASGRW